jgi:tetratricopeptide (TPR) repeat protein
MPLARNPLFVGRQEDLQHLAMLLCTGGTAAITPQAVAATGLGGLGKTQLACEFMHRYGQFFSGGVFWLSCAEPQVLPEEVAACGEGLSMPDGFVHLELAQQVRLVQRAWQEAVPRLLVFDNCEDEAVLAQWRPPHGGCRVLLTSRRGQWDAVLGVQALALEVLPRAESLALLRGYHLEMSATAADLEAIAAELGDLPLALHLAGSFLARYRHAVTPAAYLVQLRQPGLLQHRSLQGLHLTPGLSPTQHDQHVARTFAISYERLDPQDATDACALALLARAACFAPGEPIPHQLLVGTLPTDTADGEAALRTADALQRLQALGLLDWAAEGAVRLHRLLVMFVRAANASIEAQTAIEEMLLATAQRLNQAGDPRPLLALAGHLRVVTDMAQSRDDVLAARLCNELAYHLQGIAQYMAARPYYERALAIREAVLGPQHPDTARSLNNLGFVLQAQGELAAARPYYERALQIFTARLGPQHPYTQTVRDNLAGLDVEQHHRTP